MASLLLGWALIAAAREQVCRASFAAVRI